MENALLVDEEVIQSFVEAASEKLLEQIGSQVCDAIMRSSLMDRIDVLAQKFGLVADLPVDAQNDTRICTEAGCSQPARARNLCSKHYQRLRYAERRATEDGQPIPKTLAEARSNRSKKPARKTEKRGGGNCSIEGCDQPNYARGLCGKHFMEWVRSRKKI